MNIFKRRKFITFIIITLLLLFVALYFIIYKDFATNHTDGEGYEIEQITEIAGELEEIITEELEDVIIEEENVIVEDVKTEVADTDKKTEKKTNATNNNNNNAQKTETKPNNTNANTNNNQTNNNNVPKAGNTTAPQQPNNPPVEETKPKDPVETWKYNATMAKQLKSDIENNPSDLMQEFDYNVIIDENIVNTTNQFTYTQSRVLDKIINKFGTIKVYARDYYVNGELRWTECFVI